MQSNLFFEVASRLASLATPQRVEELSGSLMSGVKNFLWTKMRSTRQNDSQPALHFDQQLA
jgi:hypothetical protein